MRRRPARPVGELDDERLVKLVAHGDRAAFEELYARTSPWLLLRLRRRCSDEDLVAEVLQDSYVSLWRSAGSFSADGSAAGWLWTIAARKLIDAMRARARAQRPELAAAGSTPSAMPSAEDEALTRELDPGLAAAWAGLSPQLREVLQAVVVDGLTTREASTLLGLPEGTVKTRARRARIALRDGLTTEGGTA
ncbi:RNA polymerase sigma factor [Motilibacter deserti]|uniref:RNA polymerase sigma factor n=1 Tax=Motilibacter deserti TaxID=2714956 RepID=A0ABX0GVT5_9ACTN|nr:RNA polymerase sigma factor [Motilibacter deserti]NHC15041.1 RNA polymerase sigma factor [Motilibacter deserti]